MAAGLVPAARKRSTSHSMPCSEGTPDSNAEAKPEQSTKPSSGSTSGSQEGYDTVDDGLARADSRDGEEPFERAIMAERSTSLARLHTEASHSKVKGVGACVWGCGCKQLRCGCGACLNRRACHAGFALVDASNSRGCAITAQLHETGLSSRVHVSAPSLFIARSPCCACCATTGRASESSSCSQPGALVLVLAGVQPSGDCAAGRGCVTTEQ